MIVDPQIAIVRSSAPMEFFDRIAARIDARGEPHRGVLLQCTVNTSEGVLAVTVYRDKDSQLENFKSFFVAEAQNEMIESGETYDITRQEFELQRLFIDPDIKGDRLAIRAETAVVAGTTELTEFSPDDYRELIDGARWLDQPVPGRIAHLAWAQGEQLFATDFWETREDGELWYKSLRLAELGSQFPKMSRAAPPRSWWRELHSFTVVAEQGAVLRDFTRLAGGPSDDAS